MAGSGCGLVGLCLAFFLLAFSSGTDNQIQFMSQHYLVNGQDNEKKDSTLAVDMDRATDIPTSHFPKLKQIVKLLDNQIQFIKQKDLVNGQDNENNQDIPLAVDAERVTVKKSFLQKHKHLLSEDNLPEAILQLKVSQTQSKTTQNPFSDDSSPEGDSEKEKVLDNILKELEEKLELASKESPEENAETGSVDDEEFNIVVKSFPGEPHNVESSEVPPTQHTKEIHITNIRTGVTNEESDAKRFEFFEKYEGIQGKKKAKAEDLKDLLKYIIIASVAITGFILTVIVLVHILRSLFLKKEQEPIVLNSISTEDKPETTEEEEKEK